MVMGDETMRTRRKRLTKQQADKQQSSHNDKSTHHN
jgi:hypothetical protein